jgi:hypothetical protein
MHPHAAGAPAPMAPGNLGSFNGAWGGSWTGMSPNTGWGFGGPNSLGYNPYDEYQWIMTYKFGDAVTGVDVHRAMPYQVTALGLLATVILLALIACLVSYCAGFKMIIGIIWALLLFFATILGGAALIQFYISCMLPEYRFVYTDRRMEQIVGYSFYWALVGLIGIALSFIMSLICVVLLYLRDRSNEGNGNNIERAIVYDNYPTNRGHDNYSNRGHNLSPNQRYVIERESPQPKYVIEKERPVIHIVERSNGRPISPTSQKTVYITDPGHFTPV